MEMGRKLLFRCIGEKCEQEFVKIVAKCLMFRQEKKHICAKNASENQNLIACCVSAPVKYAARHLRDIRGLFSARLVARNGKSGRRKYIINGNHHVRLAVWTHAKTAGGNIL